MSETQVNRWRTNMNVQVFGIRVPFRLLCIVDGLLLPCMLALWYQANYAGAHSDLNGQFINHPGLFINGSMVFLAGRAVLKVERAVHAPLTYSFDSVRALRCYVVMTIMGLSVQLLSR
jgi:hypothetical protein